MSTATLSMETIAPPLKVDEHGVVRVGKTRVTLYVFLGAYKQGFSPEEIVRDFPTLSLADVHGAISYYLSHRGEVDAYLEQVEREWEEKRKEIESRPGYHEMHRSLLERAKARGLR